MTIKALCFDLDGTLARFTGDFDLLLASLRLELGLVQCDLNTFAALLSERLRGSGSVSLETSLIGVLEQFELTLPPDLARVSRMVLGDYARQVERLPGAGRLLELVSPLPLGLVTNGPSDMQRAALRRVGLERYFQTIVVSGDEDVAVRKPDPHIFEIACERLGVEPGNTLMIGDNLEADVRGALAYGMQAVWLGDRDVMGIEQVKDTVALHAYLASRLAS